MAGKNQKAYDDQLSPEGNRPVKAGDDSDVEGHSFGTKTKASDELAPQGNRPVKASDDDDVEGHGRPVK